MYTTCMASSTTKSDEPAGSRLLMYDHIAPKALAHPHSTAYDLITMPMMAGEERTRSHWRELLKSEVYKVVRI